MIGEDSEGQRLDFIDRDIARVEEPAKVMDDMLGISLRCILPVKNERPNIRQFFEDLSSSANQVRTDGGPPIQKQQQQQRGRLPRDTCQQQQTLGSTGRVQPSVFVQNSKAGAGAALKQQQQGIALSSVSVHVGTAVAAGQQQ